MSISANNLASSYTVQPAQTTPEAQPTRRRHARWRWEGQGAGVLWKTSRTRAIPFAPLDVSASGFGLTVFEKLRVGDQIVFSLQEHVIELRVAHVTPRFGGASQVGLEVLDTAEDLRMVLVKAGWTVTIPEEAPGDQRRRWLETPLYGRRRSR